MRTGKLLLLACVILLGSQVSAKAETLEQLGLSANIYRASLYKQPAVSADGKWTAFANGYDIYVSNLETGAMERISVSSDGASANSSCENPALSADGRFVVFESLATNLVTGDVNGQRDVFLRDRLLKTTEIVSIATDGTQGFLPNIGSPPTISADGRYVAFHILSPLTTKDGTRTYDIYLRDRQEKTTTRIARGIYPALSSDGRFTAYRHDSSLFLRNLRTGKVRAIERFKSEPSRNNPFAYIPSISGDGRYVVYEGWSAPGAPLSTEVFLYDSQTGDTIQITHAFDGTQLTTASGLYNTPLRPKISADGRFVLFPSSAADIVQGIDGNQLYLYDIVNRSTTHLPIDNLWLKTPPLFHYFNISGDGSVIVLQDDY